MALLAAVMRALGVAVLLATVLLPGIDHHAAQQLPETGLLSRRGFGVREAILHHHPTSGSHEGVGHPVVAALGPGTLTAAGEPETLFILKWTAGPVAPLLAAATPAHAANLGLIASAKLADSTIATGRIVRWLHPDGAGIPDSLSVDPARPPPRVSVT